MIRAFTLVTFIFILFPDTLFAQKEKKVDFFYDETLIKEEELSVTEELADGTDRLSLHACLELALEHNAELRTAASRIKEQKGVVLSAEAILLPKLDLSGSYRRVDKDSLPSVGGISLGNDETWQSAVRVTQPLYTGGRGLSARRQARKLEEAAVKEFEITVNKVVYDVKVAFYNTLLAKARVEVRKQSVELLEKQLQLEKNKLKAGTVSDFNVLRSEVELANAKTPYIKARNDLRLALDELARIIGQSVEKPEEIKHSFKIAGKLEYKDLELHLPRALEVAYKQRPELKRFTLLKEAASEGIDLARAGYFPSIDLYGGYGWQSKVDAQKLSELDEGWEAGVNASWRIFDSFETSGKVRQAKEGKSQIAIAERQERLNIDVQVRKALSDLVESRELVYASRKVLEQAEESLRLVTARNEAGVARQIDVLDTQVALTDARTNNIEALHAFNVARAALDRATGEVYAGVR